MPYFFPQLAHRLRQSENRVLCPADLGTRQ